MKSELDLIKNCQQGDNSAFGQLYDKYIKKIYDFIYYKTHHKQTAEDLTSDTFFKALSKINSFDATKGTFQAWLYQIARNTVIDHYRSSKEFINIDDAWDIEVNVSSAAHLDQQATLTEVKKYISKLSSEQRDIVIMRIWGEMSYQEIAQVLGKTEAACKMSFSRTISKIRSEKGLASLLLFMLSIV